MLVDASPATRVDSAVEEWVDDVEFFAVDADDRAWGVILLFSNFSEKGEVCAQVPCSLCIFSISQM